TAAALTAKATRRPWVNAWRAARSSTCPGWPRRRPAAATVPPRGELLDVVNVRLLSELHADARITMSAQPRRVGMSAPAVTERVQRLHRAGVITGYRMEVDPAAVGLPIAAFVRIRPAPGQPPNLAELAAQLPRSPSATGSLGRTASSPRCTRPQWSRLRRPSTGSRCTDRPPPPSWSPLLCRPEAQDLDPERLARSWSATPIDDRAHIVNHDRYFRADGHRCCPDPVTGAPTCGHAGASCFPRVCPSSPSGCVQR